MALVQVFQNDAISALAAPIGPTDTSCTLATGTGALWNPAPAAGQYSVITFTDASSGLINEIAQVTAVTGDVLTLGARGIEGTTAANWAAGDNVTAMVTAGTLANFPQNATTQTGFQNVATYANVSGVQKVSINGAAFTTVGATTFPNPPTGIAEVTVGGGGAGGGGTQLTDGTHAAVGGGGGGGTLAGALIKGLAAPTTITCGAAGTATAGANGGNGGDSSFGALVVAPGGMGGNVGAPTLAITTDVTSGANGGIAATFTGAGTIPLFGTNALGRPGLVGTLYSTSVGISGNGGDCGAYGTGGGPTDPSNAGPAGTGLGAGGAGACAGVSQAVMAGGVGATGFVQVRW